MNPSVAPAKPTAPRPMNIRDLARELSLSPGTVSRSLRHHPDTPNVTRERVIRAAVVLRRAADPGVARWAGDRSWSSEYTGFSGS